MSLLVPKTKYSRLQLPIGVAPGADAASNPLAAGFEEPANAMPGTLSYDSYRDVARVMTTAAGWQDLLFAAASQQAATWNGCRLSPNSLGEYLADGTYTRIYLSPFRGPTIALWTEGPDTWKPYLITAGDVFYDLSGRTTGRPFDVFCRVDPITQVVSLSVIDWTNSTTRATAIECVFGVFVKQGDYSYRYLGTCNATSATTYTIRQSSTSNRARIDLWNECNRVPYTLNITSNGTSNWSYDTSTWRQSNAQAEWRAEVMIGQPYQHVYASCVGNVRSTAGSGGNHAAVGIGYNNTAAPTGRRNYASTPGTSISNDVRGLTALLAHSPNAGVATYYWLERGPGTGGTTQFLGIDDIADCGVTILTWC